jgi:hypothetical protein
MYILVSRRLSERIEKMSGCHIPTGKASGSQISVHQCKKPAKLAGFSRGSAHAICVVRADYPGGELNRADASGFFAFRTRRAHERNALVFGQAFKTFRLNILEMGEQIAAACVRRDKAEAFCIVEPFDGAGLSSHFTFLVLHGAKMPEMHLRPRGGVTEEIKQDCRKARRERKTNNNNDLM